MYRILSLVVLPILVIAVAGCDGMFGWQASSSTLTSIEVVTKPAFSIVIV